MLRLLKRLIQPADISSRPVARKHRTIDSSSTPELGEPIPVPEVVEGDGGESDWNLWKDSVQTAESQWQTPATTEVSHEKTQPLSRDELNAYVTSGRRGSN